jgi:hypothetical protein
MAYFHNEFDPLIGDSANLQIPVVAQMKHCKLNMSASEFCDKNETPWLSEYHTEASMIGYDDSPNYGKLKFLLEM